jgi:transcriptional regulator with PAS, ATPase and Fis domain
MLQAAHGGTLFLDEIVELDPQVQAKLLRVIETREVLPLGATRARKIELSLCSATHASLRARVEDGRFRQDLFFRIGRPHVTLPPLRERPEEIPWLVERVMRAQDQAPHPSLVEAALTRPWPGNVRELLLEIREAGRAARAAGASAVEAQHLGAEAGRRPAAATPPPPAAEAATAPPTREAIEGALAREHGNVSATARALGVHRTQLRRWMERYRLGGEHQ